MFELNWSSILENIIAGSVIAIFFGIFLKWLTDWQNRPKLELIVNLEDSVNDFHWFSIEILNLGRSGFKKGDVVWHIYLPHIFSGGYFIDQKGQRLPVNVRSFQKRGESNIREQRHSHFLGTVDVGLAPRKAVEILYFKLPREFGRGEIEIPYQFSTNFHGSLPERARKYFWWKLIDDKEGFPELELLPLARVRDIRHSKHRGSSFIPPENISKEWF